MSENKLVIRIDREEYTAGLFGTLEVNGFKGSGEGWFNISDIQDFIKDLKRVAKSHKGKAELIGGQSDQEGSNYLERFGLRCYPIGSTGVIGVHVTLSEYPYTDCRNEEILKVSGELKSEVQLILNFVKELKGLVSGEDTTTTLMGRAY